MVVFSAAIGFVIGNKGDCSFSQLCWLILGEILRLIQVAIDEGAFEVPGEAVVESQFGIDAPRILSVEAEALVDLGFVHIVGRGLRRIADSDDTA